MDAKHILKISFTIDEMRTAFDDLFARAHRIAEEQAKEKNLVVKSSKPDYDMATDSIVIEYGFEEIPKFKLNLNVDRKSVRDFENAMKKAEYYVKYMKGPSYHLSAKDIVFESFGVATAILRALRKSIDENGFATVGEFYEMVGIETSYGDDGYGWDNLPWNVYPYHVADRPGSYYLNLPEPQRFDKKEKK